MRASAGVDRFGASPLVLAGAFTVMLVGCLDIREEIAITGSVLRGTFAYELTVPRELLEIDPEIEADLSRCDLPSVGEPPRSTKPGDLEIANIAKRLALRRTREEKIGETLYCRYTFHADVAEWSAMPQSPLLSHVKRTERPKPGWWIYVVPEDLTLGNAVPEWLIEMLVGEVQIESMVRSPQIVAEGYTEVEPEGWWWKGTLHEAIRSQPRYWVPDLR